MQNGELLDIACFWHGRYLRIVDRLCLMSMQKAGHHVRLYSYMPIANVPNGIESCDANEIMPFSFIYRLDPDFPNYRPEISLAQFSDFFRAFLMKRQDCVWLDTDVYLVKPFLVQKGDVWLAKESEKRLGISALYLPSDSPIITKFEEYIANNEIIPSWLGFKRRVLKPLYLKLTGKKLTTPRLGITVFGNDGMSRLAKSYGFYDKAYPKESFYYWHARLSERIFDPKYGLEPLNHKDFIGFHIHYKEKTKYKPKPGSFYDWAIRRLPEFEDYRLL